MGNDSCQSVREDYRNLPSEPFLIGSRPRENNLRNNASVTCEKNSIRTAVVENRRNPAQAGLAERSVRIRGIPEAGIAIAVCSFQPHLGHERDASTVS